MKGLSGADAVTRLEERGGQVVVFRRDYGHQVAFVREGREDGAALVVGRSPVGSPGRYGPKRFVLRTDADRARLAREMELAVSRANADLDDRVEYRYALTHMDFFSDAGFGQIGCLLAAPSLVVGLIVGVIGCELVSGDIPGTVWWASPIAGLVVATLALGPVSKVVYKLPRVRDSIELIAYGWMLIAPGVATAATAIGMAVLKIGG